MGLYAVSEQKLAHPDRVLSQRKMAVGPDHQNPQPSIYIVNGAMYAYTVYVYTAL